MSGNPMATALGVAYRHFGATDTTEAERDAILSAMTTALDGEQAELASEILYHRTKARERQLMLSGMLSTKLPETH